MKVRFFLIFLVIFFTFNNFFLGETTKNFKKYTILGKIIAVRGENLFTMEVDPHSFESFGGITLYNQLDYFIINDSEEITYCLKPLSYYRFNQNHYIHLLKVKCDFLTIYERNITIGEPVVTLKKEMVVDHTTENDEKKQPDIIFHPIDKKEMVYVSGDYFIYGQGDDSSEPSFNPNYYRISYATIPFIRSFYIDKYEVTNYEFLKFCEKTRYPCPSFLYNLKPHEKDVAYVHATYEDVENYAKWTKKQIPTEWEWEFAAKGGLREIENRFFLNAKLFPEFTNSTDYCNTFDKWIDEPKPLNVYKLRDINFRGLVGLCGNALEWTSSYFFPYPGHRFLDILNQNMSGNFFRVLRGGAYFLPIEFAKIHKRIPGGFPYFKKDPIGGFRLIIRSY